MKFVILGSILLSLILTSCSSDSNNSNPIGLGPVEDPGTTVTAGTSGSSSNGSSGKSSSAGSGCASCSYYSNQMRSYESDIASTQKTISDLQRSGAKAATVPTVPVLAGFPTTSSAELPIQGGWLRLPVIFHVQCLLPDVSGLSGFSPKIFLAEGIFHEDCMDT